MNRSWLAFFDETCPGLGPEQLDQLEADAGVQLPISLRELYGTLSEGRFRLGLYVDADDTYFDLNRLIPAHKSSPLNSGFVEALKFNRDRGFIPSNLVPFADESGGNVYCIDRNDESIWYADMELDGDWVPPAKRIADSLDALLKGLREPDDD